MSSTCPVSKTQSKDSARFCARGLLTKALFRPGKVNNNDELVGRIESAINNYYDSRTSYLAKISKIALHLSNFTRTGRSSYSFQDKIINDKLDTDEFIWMMTEALDDEIFPEFTKSNLDSNDWEFFNSEMSLEQTALFNGLNEVVKQCCDLKMCSAEEINVSYDEVLFKRGNVFEQAAQQICYVRGIFGWNPMESDVTIIDRTDSICMNLMELVDWMALLDDNKLLYIPNLKRNLNEAVQEEVASKWRIEIELRRSYNRLNNKF